MPTGRNEIGPVKLRITLAQASCAKLSLRLLLLWITTKNGKNRTLHCVHVPNIRPITNSQTYNEELEAVGRKRGGGLEWIRRLLLVQDTAFLFHGSSDWIELGKNDTPNANTMSAFMSRALDADNRYTSMDKEAVPEPAMHELKLCIGELYAN